MQGCGQEVQERAGRAEAWTVYGAGGAAYRQAEQTRGLEQILGLGQGQGREQAGGLVLAWPRLHCQVACEAGAPERGLAMERGPCGEGQLHGVQVQGPLRELDVGQGEVMLQALEQQAQDLVQGRELSSARLLEGTCPARAWALGRARGSPMVLARELEQAWAWARGCELAGAWAQKVEGARV